MPKYAILKETPFKDQTLYEVVLQADDGYSETQQYVGDEKTLIAAAQHFNAERMKMVSAVDVQAEEDAKPVEEQAEPVFVEVKE